MWSEELLTDRYSEMASDTEREQEAQEWCEGWVADTAEIADSSQL